MVRVHLGEPLGSSGHSLAQSRHHREEHDHVCREKHDLGEPLRLRLVDERRREGQDQDHDRDDRESARSTLLGSQETGDGSTAEPGEHPEDHELVPLKGLHALAHHVDLIRHSQECGDPPHDEGDDATEHPRDATGDEQLSEGLLLHAPRLGTTRAINTYPRRSGSRMQVIGEP